MSEAVESNGTASREEGPELTVVLASASPRRRELLEQAGVRFVVHAAEVDESLEPDLVANPEEAAKKLAERKAGAVVQEILAGNPRGAIAVIGADTMVVLDDEIFGKPRNLAHATEMLQRLSGRTHQVITGVSLWMILATSDEDVSLGFRTFADVSDVAFHELSDETIAEYLSKGESFDKAGAYAVQGEGAALVASIEGSLDTVIGLPVERLLRDFPDLLRA